MKNVGKAILQAYYNALDDNISVPVYKVDVPQAENGNHVILRLESESDETNKKYFVTMTVITADVVTIGTNSINPDTANDIDNEVRQIIKSTIPATLTAAGFQVSFIKPDNGNYLEEDDGAKRYYRKVTRFTNRIKEN